MTLKIDLADEMQLEELGIHLLNIHLTTGHLIKCKFDSLEYRNVAALNLAEELIRHHAGLGVYLADVHTMDKKISIALNHIVYLESP